MPDIAASTLARLKNKSKETGRSYQLCLQLFCQEEFLRRLENSKYSNNFILKGGLFIYTLTSFESRSTIDIDFLIKKLPNTPDEIMMILKEIIQSNSENDYVKFNINKVERINITKKYSGIGANLIAQIKNTKTTVNIDLGVGDIIVPKQEKRSIITQLEGFRAPLINTYSLESTIAEKLDAILSLMEFGSRMKDYYDIYYLANQFNFNGEMLQKAIRETFMNRDRTYSIDLFNQVMTFGSDDGMQKKWLMYIRKIDADNLKFNDVLKIMDLFLRELYITIVNNRKFNKQWISSKNTWK